MKVSVVMMTYNHERFIAQAVNSVLLQDVDFEYELLIGEDCSSDRTREILIEMQGNAPDKIRLFLNDVNIGMFHNLNQLLGECKGEYIALLEGDDYWSSPLKLKKQVDFLDRHPGFSICFHNVISNYEDGSHSDVLYCSEDQKGESSLADLMVSDFIPTCSVMYRKGVIRELPDWCLGLPMCDWPLLILNAKYGKIGYIKETMAVYRIHAGGVWSANQYIKRLFAYIQLLQSVKPYVEKQYQDIANARLNTVFNQASEDIFQRGIQAKSVKDASKNAEDEIRYWSRIVQVPNSWGRKVIGRIYAYFGFTSYKEGNFTTTRYCLPRAIYHDISWLANKGVWSIFMRAWIAR